MNKINIFQTEITCKQSMNVLIDDDKEHVQEITKMDLVVSLTSNIRNN